jgi:hypothetical protein
MLPQQVRGNVDDELAQCPALQLTQPFRPDNRFIDVSHALRPRIIFWGMSPLVTKSK